MFESWGKWTIQKKVWEIKGKQSEKTAPQYMICGCNSSCGICSFISLPWGSTCINADCSERDLGGFHQGHQKDDFVLQGEKRSQ